MTNMQSQPSNVMHLGMSLFQHVCKANNLLPGFSKLAHPRQPQALNFGMQKPGAMQQEVSRTKAAMSVLRLWMMCVFSSYFSIICTYVFQ